MSGKHKDGSFFPISLQIQYVKSGPVELFRGRMEKTSWMEAAFTLDERGVIIACNHNFVIPLFGYSHGELVGKQLDILLPGIHLDNLEPNTTYLSCPDLQEQQKVDFGNASASVMSVSGPSGSSSSIWQSTGIHRQKAMHKDGSRFPVILEIAPIKLIDGRLFSAKIRRFVEPGQKRKRIGDYFLSTTLGVGSSGRVKLAKHYKTKETVAVKIINKFGMSKEEVDRVDREVKILRQLNHPHIAVLREVINSNDDMNIVMEYGGKTLHSYIHENKGLGEEESRKYFKQLLSALQYCHDRNIVHRDLKPQNILVDIESGLIKLIDFGMSNFVQKGQLRNTFCGTYHFAAPEMIRGEKYHGPEVDIWSMGVVLYYMLTGKAPFENVVDTMQGNYIIPELKEESLQILDLLNKIFQVNRSERVKLEDVIQHPWVLTSKVRTA